MNELNLALEDLHTLNDMVRWAVSQFNQAKLHYGHGSDNPWDEATSLILHAVHLTYDLPEIVWHARLTKSEKQQILQILLRRIEDRIPAAYLTHQMRFAGLDFYVDQRVLVPRSPIAELVENRFTPWLHNDHAESILELCTGSGCIAVACAYYLPEAQIDAVDISKEALAVAQMNIDKHHCEDQVQLFEGDLFAPVPKGKTYDLIIANPPYVDAEDMASLPLEYQHEPRIGLAAGEDGLEIVKRILAEAKQYLKPTGAIIVEVGNSEIALMQQYPEVPFTWLEFTRAEGGVFLLTYQDLLNYL